MTVVVERILKADYMQSKLGHHYSLLQVPQNKTYLYATSKMYLYVALANVPVAFHYCR